MECIIYEFVAAITADTLGEIDLKSNLIDLY